MPSPAQEVAGLFLFPDEPDEGPLRTITLRIPSGRLAWIDALAKNADRSRNVMAGQLLRVGISAVLGELPDPVREDIEQSVLVHLEGDE